MTIASQYQSAISVITTTIANGASTSAAVDLGGAALVGIQLPAAFTGTALSFQVATSLGGTYQALTNSTGSNLAPTVAQGKYLLLNPSDFAGVQYIKIVSNATEGGARTLELITRPL